MVWEMVEEKGCPSLAFRTPRPMSPCHMPQLSSAEGDSSLTLMKLACTAQVGSGVPWKGTPTPAFNKSLMRAEQLIIWRFSAARRFSIRTPRLLMNVTAEKSRSTLRCAWSAVRHSASSKGIQSNTIRPSSLHVTWEGLSATLVIRSTAILLLQPLLSCQEKKQSLCQDPKSACDGL